MSQSEPQHKRALRADAERNMTTILEAAAHTLADRPEASIEDIAKAAGVARQTVYAHYASRDALISAVLQRAMDEALSVLDAAHLDQGPPDAALERLIDLSWRTSQTHRVFELPAAPNDSTEEYEGHRPFLDRLERLIVRGQREGVIDQRLSPTWSVAAFIGLAHAAGDEVGAGRMRHEDALVALKRSLWRLYGIDNTGGIDTSCESNQTTSTRTVNGRRPD